MNNENKIAFKSLSWISLKKYKKVQRHGHRHMSSMDIYYKTGGDMGGFMSFYLWYHKEKKYNQWTVIRW